MHHNHFPDNNFSSCPQKKILRTETYKVSSSLYFTTSVELLNVSFQITQVFPEDIPLELVSVILIAGGELVSRTFLTYGWYVLIGAKKLLGFSKILYRLHLILQSQKFIPLAFIISLFRNTPGKVIQSVIMPHKIFPSKIHFDSQRKPALGGQLEIVGNFGST